MSTTYNDMITIIHAAKAGQEIEEADRDALPRTEYRWFPFVTDSLFDFEHRVYRIKPPAPPKPREWWIYPIKGSSTCYIDTVPGPELVHVKGVGTGKVVHVREVLPEA